MHDGRHSPRSGLIVEAGGGIAARFTWHPRYAGRLLLDVREEVVRDVSADQRAYALAMEAAEAREDDALASVLRLERRWGPYDLNWADADPEQLADRIVRWEWERERRQELFPFSEVRAQTPLPNVPAAQQSWLEWLRRLFGGQSTER